MAKSLTVLCLIVTTAYGEAACLIPEVLEAKESYCYRNHVDMIDRIHETSQNLLNLARRKLGKEVLEGEKIPEKCEYYQCILEELRLLNSKKIPIYEVIKTWIEENVIYSNGIDLLKRLNLCDEFLVNSTATNQRFRGDLTTEKYQNEEDKDVFRKCDLDAEFLRCLSLQEGCPMFKYP